MDLRELWQSDLRCIFPGHIVKMVKEWNGQISNLSISLLYKWITVIYEWKNVAHQCHLGSSKVVGNSAFFRPTCGMPAHSSAMRWRNTGGRSGICRAGSGSCCLKIHLIIFLLCSNIDTIFSPLQILWFSFKSRISSYWPSFYFVIKMFYFWIA